MNHRLPRSLIQICNWSPPLSSASPTWRLNLLFRVNARNRSLRGDCSIERRQDDLLGQFHEVAHYHLCRFSSVRRKSQLEQPNYRMFDSEGNLYVSESGEWSRSSGCVMRSDRQGHGETFWKAAQSFPNGLALDADERFLLSLKATRMMYLG
jgi:hypothetical protein